MSGTGDLRGELDALADRAGTELVETASRSAFSSGLTRGWPLLAAAPFLYAFAEFGRWLKDEPAYGFPVVPVALIGAASPFAYAWWKARAARARGSRRDVAIGTIDERASLEGRLLAADEFTAAEGPALSGFERAAVEDAAARLGEARAVRLADAVPPPRFAGASWVWAAAAAMLLAASIWFAGLERGTPGGDEATVGDAPPSAVAPPDSDEETRDASPEPAPEPPPETADARRKKAVAARAETPEASPRVTQDAKKSSGKTGAGRSSGAMSSSAASQSKSAPSSAGQKSDPAKDMAKPKPADKKAPKETEEDPEATERPEDEQSGSTAGKGSSKGSNKNPTASDWKSRDQVTDTDDQEVEDDEDTDEDEEEQENRGGVQPSLRDRRPPVSRDLQIGFGNRPNPDANGRGGPSEQKKSRGVASLVLGVPIPDRIKGRPGPGPTKITQERIEPEAEEAGRIAAAARRARTGDLGQPSSMKLDASLRSLVRDWFLAQRAKP